MSRAEVQILPSTLPAEETPPIAGDDAQPPAGAPLPRGGFFGAAGTVEDQLRTLEIRLLAEVEGDPRVEQHVRRLLSAAHARFARATVRRFLPILIERHVRGQLDRR